MKRTKIWIGVGAFVVAGASSIQAGQAEADDAPGFRAPVASMQTSGAAIVVAQHAGQHGGEAGEGGEGGEGGARGLPPDLDFALKIALIRGHLLIGDQLIAEKQWNAAFPHFAHPEEELYDDVRDHLKTYGAPPFAAALKVIVNLVKNKKGGDEYAKALQVVRDALDAADAGVKSKQQDFPSFQMAAALETLKVSADEYEEAIVKGRIGKAVEYQDARGFILQAEGMIESVAPELEKKNAEALKGIRSALADLKKAFPTAMPPKAPIKDYGGVLGDISRIELAAGPLM